MLHEASQQIHFIKDLTRLGRPLSKTIIIDNTRENFAWQKQNGVCIPSFFDDQNDTELLTLMGTLKQIALS
jgi:TFIIF-interacting CTD phosphatase-like protein